MRPAPRRTASLLLACALVASAAAAVSESELPAALDTAVAAAETSLRQNDLRAAESHYKEALFDGWLLIGAIERIEKRLPEARSAVRRAFLFANDSPEQSRTLATAQLQTGEPEEAVSVLTALVAREGGDGNRRLLATALAAAGKREQAIATLDELRAKASADPEQLFLLGSQYLWLQRADIAETLYEKAFAARPLAQTRVLIGRAYRDAGEYARARRQLEAALKLDATVRRAHYYLGMVARGESMAAERFEEAEREFRAELLLSPGEPLASDQLGMLLLDAGRTAEALAPLQDAVRGEERYLYLTHLGRCLLALEKAALAETSLRRALELSGPQGATSEERERIHYLLGSTARALGKTEEATTQFAEARRLFALRNDPAAVAASAAASACEPRRESSVLAEVTPERRAELRRHVDASLTRVYLNLGVIQAQDGSVPAVERFERAAASFEKAAEIDPEFPQVQASLGVARFNAGQFDKATEPLERALAKSPADGKLKRMLAAAWLDTQAWQKAATLLDDDPELAADPGLQFGRGLALLHSGHAAEAERVLEALLTQQGESAEPLVLLGQARLDQGRYQPAVESLERALQLRPDVADGRTALGIAYWKLGRLEQAETALRAALGERPSDRRAKAALAAVLDASKRPDEAVSLLREVLAADAQAGASSGPAATSPADSGQARLLLGSILFAKGDASGAMGELEAAARLLPESARAHQQLAEVYRKLGRKAEAERERDDARRLEREHGGDGR